MASGKRCHYEVLGLSRDCTADEIRSAYKKLALRLHPDKLIQTGLSQAEATSQFQELSYAYEVLSDPKERAWYDSHRSQILFSDPDSARADSFAPDLFSYFSNTVYSGYGDKGKGFYKVYKEVFDRVYANEVSFVRKLGLGFEKVREAPVMGNLESPYEQVTAFYGYWLGFATVMDFCWVDRWDAASGVNRKSRRVMEEENGKLRRKARKEYNEMVRGLAEFVKKRDKRVIDMMVKKGKEEERRKEEEKERKRRLERERMERAKGYEEPEWARVEEEEIEGSEEVEVEVDVEGKKDGKMEEFYCVVCGKKFKSEKQWKNHEQSKKHKEKVAELRHTFEDEDKDEDSGREVDDVDEYEEAEDDGMEDRDVNELETRFKEGFNVEEERRSFGGNDSSNGEEGFLDAEDGEDGNNVKVDEETSVLEAMLSGHKNRKARGSRQDLSKEVTIEDRSEEVDDMPYDNRKSRRRRGKKERGRNNDREDVKCDDDNNNSPCNEMNKHENDRLEESSSSSFLDVEDGANTGGNLLKSHKHSDSRVEKRGKSKNSSKGKKGKGPSNDSGNMCHTCGEEFNSRNKLHKHLGDTGHATLKHR